MLMMVSSVRVHRVEAHGAVDSRSGHGWELPAATVTAAARGRSASGRGSGSYDKTACGCFGGGSTDGQDVPQIGQLLFVLDEIGRGDNVRGAASRASGCGAREDVLEELVRGPADGGRWHLVQDTRLETLEEAERTSRVVDFLRGLQQSARFSGTVLLCV